jgi:hypothetical protein
VASGHIALRVNMGAFAPFCRLIGPPTLVPTTSPSSEGNEEMTGPIRTATLALVAAAVASASPAVAAAEPKEWGIGTYDQCTASYPYDRQENIARWYDHLKYCCLKTGGVWEGSLSPLARSR